ncbi:ComF family protein [Citricoccus nitrophenolicus]|uniref:ComF family protein n=1 Tax=Citricoccus nitrophenolicus TaxID=863575 RepID=UPI0039B4BC27
MDTRQRLATLLDSAVHTRTARSLASASRELTGLLLPSLCVLCGDRDGAVCPECAPGLAAETRQPFRAERGAAALPLRFIEQGPAPVPVVAAARYGAEASRALLAFKDHGRSSVARFLRPAVYRALEAVPELLGLTGPFTLVPVPGSAAGFRRRGIDPVEELLRGPLPRGWMAARGWVSHRRPSPPAVVRQRTSHAGTGSRQRRSVARDRFRPTHRLTAGFVGSARHERPTVVVFDDVMTTGSTLSAMWRALELGGISPAGAVVLASVAPPGAVGDEGLNSG